MSRIARRHLRWLRAELVYLAQSLGYVIRPYDQLLDARRWRWQQGGVCPRVVLHTLSPESADQLRRAAAELHDRRTS